MRYLSFISEKGKGFFTMMMAILSGSFVIWTSNSVTELQKYFGILALIMVFMFFFLLILIDYLNEETKKEILKNFGKKSSSKKV